MAMKKAGIEIPNVKPQGTKDSKPDGKNEISKEWRPMIIDLELQTVDSPCRRLWDYFKYFVSHIFLDKCSIILIILTAALIACTVICYILPFKTSHPASQYK